MKTHSSFFNEEIITLLRKNQKTNKAAGLMAAKHLESTEPWMKLTHEELKGLVFTPEIKRSWFVMSDGSCPDCGKSVPMYNWTHDPFLKPWKVTCPHCGSDFPKNDFGAYYNSGLDDDGVFRYSLADKSLLINPDGTGFCVDDGSGWYDANQKRYMFIGAYLCHARWRKQVFDGITYLSFSYVLTGETEYAYRTAILLDAIARFWPEYDFYTQGLMYEKEYKSHGYVGYWAGSAQESRIFALAYDQIFDAMAADDGFFEAVGRSFNDFTSRVEKRILNDSLENMDKIFSNPPETPQTVAVIKSVLNHAKEEIEYYIDELISENTCVDGLSGESGLGGYAAISPRGLADLMCLFSNTDPDFISSTFKRHPQLYKTYRFHIDTWYDASYYPGIGDNSIFALPSTDYVALFAQSLPLFSYLYRSREWFAMELADYFNDPDFAKAIYLTYGKSKGVFNNDYYITEPGKLEDTLESIIEEYGSNTIQNSINYDQWRLSILHCSSGDNRSMIVMPYDSGKNHCHHDALSLHLFHKGVNISPDYGYPPVNYGGWKTKQALWYKHPATHNQVVIDGKRHTNIPTDGDGMFHRYPEYGKNMMFCDTALVKAVYNSAPEYNEVERNERLCALIKAGNNDSYVLDISRTEGGNEHVRFLHGSSFDFTSKGLSLSPADDFYPEETILRNHFCDSTPEDDWYVDFPMRGDDMTSGVRNIHMRYRGLTPGLSVSTCQSWVDITRMLQINKEKTGNRSIWIPTIYETAYGPKSQIAGVIELYEDSSFIEKTSVFNTGGDFDFAAAVYHKNGCADIVIAVDPKSDDTVRLNDPQLETDALLAVVRYKDGKLTDAVISSGTFIMINGTEYSPDQSPDYITFR